MDKFPLLREGKPVGELTTERGTQGTCFRLRCHLPKEGLWCAWAIGDRGELRLGVLQPQKQQDAALEKWFSERLTLPVGKLLRGEIRPAGQETLAWKPLREGPPFQTPWLARQLGNWPGTLWVAEGKLRLVAVPYDAKAPFPMMPMFCFARLRRLNDRQYLVIALNHQEWPVF